MGIVDFPAGWGLSVHLRELPFQTREDVLRCFPSYWAEADNAIVNAHADALLEMTAKRASDAAAYYAARDPAYAVGNDLDVCGVAAGVARALGEGDDSYRARILAAASATTPVAILDAIYAITSRLSSARPYYIERPYDEPHVWDDDGVAEYGWYPDALYPVIHPGNRDAARGFSVRQDLVYDARVAGYPSDAPFNAAGEVTIAIPAVVASELDAVYAFTETQGPYLDPDLLTPSIGATFPLEEQFVTRFDLMPDVFDAADLVANAALGRAVVDSDREGSAVVRAVEHILETRLAWPFVGRLMLDPKLG